MELAAVADRAHLCGIYVRPEHSGLFQNPQIGFEQIHAGAPVQVRSFREQSLELDGHLGTNFKTARTDSGPDRHLELSRPRSVARLQMPYRPLGDAGDRTPPPGVNCGDGLVGRVDQQQRQAVGRLHRQEDIGLIGHEAVPFAGDAAWARSLQGAVGVDLLEKRQRLQVKERLCPRAKTVAQPLDPIKL